jgi:hypothetical protein
MASSFWPSCLPEAELFAQGSEERRQAGQEHFTEVFLAMLQSVSHPQLSALADWACNDSGTLHTSQISLMRNNKLRMLGTKAVDVLGRVNQMAWAAIHHPELLPRLGCAPLSPQIEKILSAYKPLVDPVSNEPLGSGAFLEIYLGLRRLPIQWPRSLEAKEAERLVERLVDWLEGELQTRNWSLREAGQRLQEAWGGEASGARRLVRVLAGLESYTAKQLIDGWEEIAAAVLQMLDHEPDVWALADALLMEPEARSRQRRSKAGGPTSGQPKGPAPSTERKARSSRRSTGTL